MSGAVQLIATGKALLASTWTVSIYTGKYLFPALLGLGLWQQRPSSLQQLCATVIYSFRDILMGRKRYIIYGLLAAGFLHLLAPGQLLLPAALALLSFSYALFRAYKKPPETYKTEGWQFYLESSIYTAIILVSIAAIILKTPTLNSIAALFVYGIVFWKL